MMRKKITSKNEFWIIFSLITFLIIFPSTIQAMNFGSVQKNNYANVKEGDSVKFIVLFWNMDNSYFPINLKVKEAPSDWMIFIRPSDFILYQTKPANPPYEDNVEYITLQNNLIKPEVVEVLVKIPESTYSGEYEIIIKAEAGDISSDISILMEKNLKFTVNVEGSKTKENSNIPFIGEYIGEKATGLVSNVNNNSMFLIVLSSLFLVGIILIYRYYSK